jgi:hypothetical protein
MKRIARGALAGLFATVPMTIVMETLHRFLPQEERYPLPPRQVAMEVAEDTGLEKRMDESERTRFTLASHFAFGSAAGALCGPVAERMERPLLSGACLGFAVWAGNYLGLLPAVRLLTPATEHPVRRSALMITAHLVWGATLALLVHEWSGLPAETSTD